MVRSLDIATDSVRSVDRTPAASRQDLSATVPLEQPSTCCDNGNFGETHDCQKQPEQPAPQDARPGHITTGDVRHCIEGTCRCDEVTSLREQVERLELWKRENIGKVLEYDEAEKVLPDLHYPEALGGHEMTLADKVERLKAERDDLMKLFNLWRDKAWAAEARLAELERKPE